MGPMVIPASVHVGAALHLFRGPRPAAVHLAQMDGTWNDIEVCSNLWFILVEYIYILVITSII